MLILPERSSADLAKVRSKSCLTAIVDARLVDSRIIVHDANKACIKIKTYRIWTA